MKYHSLLIVPAVSALVLMSLISLESRAQSGIETCPCFSHEEVESTFLKALQMTDEEGTSECGASDYTVECNAEMVIWDQNFTTVAKIRVEWFDFDPGGCEFIDNSSEPVVKRNVRWPHPAPEATARACYNIITSVIKELDTSGKCFTYP